MFDDATLLMVRETLLLFLLVAGPILGVGIASGLVISLFQAVTSIQDQTLTFVPKIVGMVLLAAAIVPWIAMRLAEYAVELFTLTV